ncbi:hypothetical protein GCM10025882_22990 [Acinetobacter gyllenbergii]|uniref:Uncharacterized protein n=1 Tax=Acinetobacter gyllenbergii CIP 110306 = MTCC 11365 TaxID=1217657 RepID=A0A829HPW7_9GAMM|nr:hypothetical protein [Acinetobacter gyllenbergii]EPF93344.1 hypothetical protein F957_00140 [Acinetobacter gyllenbergii CIP 110306 = MTCC 11365]GMA11874.1 hypothetical protein GCM10025882_22990 [Acinetobacter gyllenbergii]
MLTEIAEFFVKFFVGLFSISSSDSSEYPKVIEFTKGLIIGLSAAVLSTIKYLLNGGIKQDMYSIIFFGYLFCLGVGIVLGIFFIVVNYPYKKK